MRVALVAPRFPPSVCGVGDHSARLAQSLADQGHIVRVWAPESASRAAARSDGASFDVVPATNGWGAWGLARIAREIASWRPDSIVVQYTPYLFSPGGRLAGAIVVPWLVGLRRLARAPIAVVAHELHYPVEASARGLLLGVPQAQVFFGVALAADHVFFSYQQALSRFQRLLPWRAGRLHWLPVGANVEPTHRTRRARSRREGSTLVYFGGAHPTQRLDWALDCLARATESGRVPKPVRLVFLGDNRRAVEALLEAPDRKPLRAGVEILGEQPAAEVSRWLARADLVVAPFSDGVSTRRSSVMAALAHGCPVLTTRGTSTDPGVPWSKACRLVATESDGALDKFSKAAVELLSSREKREGFASFGRQLYVECFAWPLIAEMLMAPLSRDRG